MIQLIIGEKGKGKTKILLDKANTEIKSANGSVVYVDKSKQHMYELNNRIRLIDITAYPLENSDSFIGFLCGLISQDNDLEIIYLDSFLKITHIEDQDVTPVLDQIIRLGEAFHITFVISISLTRQQLPDKFEQYIICE